MKKQNIKNILNIYKKGIFVLIFSSGFWIGVIFAAFLETPIINQTASWTGSFDSKISIQYENTSSGAYYVNQWNNSSEIWNSFKWYYYDSVYWYFKLDWSNDNEENVRITDSTNKCTTGYWYKLDWKAKWWYAGFIDFWYDNTTFVYYCLDDNKMYWRAFGKYIWYQDFEWIELEILPDVKTLVEYVAEDTIFINDTSAVDDITKPTWRTSNAWYNKLWWNTFNIYDTKESIFYIIK